MLRAAEHTQRRRGEGVLGSFRERGTDSGMRNTTTANITADSSEQQLKNHDACR